jgi:hypothetical protein
VDVLSADGDIRSFGRIESGGQIEKRRANHDLVAGVSGNERQEVAEEVASLIRSLVHLPVGGHYFFSHE